MQIYFRNVDDKSLFPALSSLSLSLPLADIRRSKFHALLLLRGGRDTEATVLFALTTKTVYSIALFLITKASQGIIISTKRIVGISSEGRYDSTKAAHSAD